ncbi:hypothetical protein [Pseudactinotalea suaedae]|uniref:hypothetical protein n=1 Tax=Pseudactinotalea suaedae TaxID=1524924 RepID=UPI0012E1BADF|nr:hypothetical protein [Pseudactinotalea suaedae]
MRQPGSPLRVLAVLVVAVLLIVLPHTPAHADEPPWSPAGYELQDDAAYLIDGESRCSEGGRWTWASGSEQVGLILVPCESPTAAQAAASGQVLFSEDHPEEKVLDVEHVSWSESDGVALRVWVQETTIVVLATSVPGGDAAQAFELGAEHAPDLAAALPGDPLPPEADGYGVQGILIAAPLMIWLLLVLPARAVVALRRPRYDVATAEPRWRDITPAAAALTRRRRWRRAGWWVTGIALGLVVFGVLNTALGAVVDGVARVLVGVLGTVGGVVMVRKNAALPVEHAGRLPTTLGARAWWGTALSALAYALAIGVVLGTALAAVASVVLPPADRIPSIGEIAAAGSAAPVLLLVTVGLLIRDSMVLVLLGVVALLVAVAGIDALGRRLRAASLREVLVADPRPPILYLRSFDEDRLTLPATLHRRGLMDTLNVIRRRRFEEAIVVQLQRSGPVVAIAPPGARLPKIGAARASYGHDEWQEKVTELAQRAAVVVLSATPSSVREGFGWEIDLVANRLEHGRVMVVVAPWRGQLARRWEAFRSYVSSLPFFADLASASLPDGLLVAARTSRWGWSSWGATRRTDVTYAVAIDHALHALGEDMAGLDDDPDAVDPLLADAGA